VRIRFTLDIERRRPVEESVPEFEHRDNDTLAEATGGGDPRAHRMGFLPSPVDPDMRVGMQPARVQVKPSVRKAGL
jgi:hypothetical protein